MTSRSMLVLCALAGAIACATVQVETEVGPEADFGRYATFVQAPPPRDDPSRPRYTPELGERIRDEIQTVLASKGLRAAASGDADLTVAFVVHGESSSRFVNAGDPDSDYYVRQDYSAGTMVIDFFDDSGARIWRGIGQTDVVTSGQLVPADVERTALETVREILARFPAVRASDS